MKWPELVPPAVCRVPIAVTLTNGNDEDGAPRVAVVVETMCNYNGKGGWSVDERARLYDTRRPRFSRAILRRNLCI